MPEASLDSRHLLIVCIPHNFSKVNCRTKNQTGESLLPTAQVSMKLNFGTYLKII